MKLQITFIALAFAFCAQADIREQRLWRVNDKQCWTTNMAAPLASGEHFTIFYDYMAKINRPLVQLAGAVVPLYPTQAEKIILGQEFAWDVNQTPMPEDFSWSRRTNSEYKNLSLSVDRRDPDKARLSWSQNTYDPNYPYGAKLKWGFECTYYLGRVN